jgi:hypothetical protein
VPNDKEACVIVAASGLDEDKDGIDDACDPVIDETPMTTTPADTQAPEATKQVSGSAAQPFQIVMSSLLKNSLPTTFFASSKNVLSTSDSNDVLNEITTPKVLGDTAISKPNVTKQTTEDLNDLTKPKSVNLVLVSLFILPLALILTFMIFRRKTSSL